MPTAKESSEGESEESFIDMEKLKRKIMKRRNTFLLQKQLKMKVNIPRNRKTQSAEYKRPNDHFDVRSVNQTGKARTYLRRRSCCCRDCLVAKPHYGQFIVIEGDDPYTERIRKWKLEKD